MLTAALTDRLTHKSDVLNMNRPSFRMRETEEWIKTSAGKVTHHFLQFSSFIKMKEKEKSYRDLTPHKTFLLTYYTFNKYDIYQGVTGPHPQALLV